MTAIETADAQRMLPLLYLANDVLQRTKDSAQRAAYVVEFAKCVCLWGRVLHAPPPPRR